MYKSISVSTVLMILGLLPTVAFSHSFRRVVPASDKNDAASSNPCTFPDGTHPVRAGIHCYNPKQFLEAYGIDKLHKAGITGKGQTIVLVDAFGSPTMQADLDTFSDTYGLPRKQIKFIYPNGVYVNPLSKEDPKNPDTPVADEDKIGWAGETTLDLEWAHAVAPDAELVNVITNVSETEGMAGLPELFRGIEMAAIQYPNGIVSMSFGTGEPTFTGQEIQDELKGKLHSVLEFATRSGMTLLAATGDNGTASEDLALTEMMDLPAAGYPAVDPLVTAVGGTSVQYGWKWNPQGTIDDYLDCKIRQKQLKTTNPKATIAPCPMDFLASEELPGNRTESIWKEDWALAAGGGGFSTIFTRPDYQGAIAATGDAAGRRMLPDVSMNAAINGGVITYASYKAPGQDDKSPVWSSIGGTSAATPEMAGLVALAGQRASDLLGKNVGIGSLNSLLYTLKSEDFNNILPETFGTKGQVTLGDNSLFFSGLGLQIFGESSETPIQVPGYAVTTGYDMATGLGTPIADRMVEDLAQARVAKERFSLPTLR